MKDKVELVFQDESSMGYADPFVAVYVNGVQQDKVWAYIDKQQGADGGWYPVIKFRRGMSSEAELVKDSW